MIRTEALLDSRILSFCRLRTLSASAAIILTNVTGVFAVGDVRSESVKHVGAAIGEGATVVQQIHALLEMARTNRSGQPAQIAAAA